MYYADNHIVINIVSYYYLCQSIVVFQQEKISQLTTVCYQNLLL
jgi:hypothetical protein